MDDRPIGVFDSGFGGVSVLANLVEQLPDERFIFLGDNLHAPYGDRSAEEVLQFTRAGIHRLMELGCKAIVIACNTATSAAAVALRAELSLPIIGMEPALKTASQLPTDGAVLVMATAMTLKLDKFRHLMELYGQDAVPVPCPGLVELIEAGQTEGPAIQAKLSSLLGSYLTTPVKAVVLGCTHYVFLKNALHAYLPPGVELVDGNEGTARQLKKQLKQHLLLHPTAVAGSAPTTPGSGPGSEQVTFLTTAPDEHIPQRMRAWFHKAVAELPPHQADG